MEKQVILSEYEYERLTKIVALAVKLNDSYVATANKSKDLSCHIMDSPKVDKTQKELYHILLYLDSEVKQDIVEEIGQKYFEDNDSILVDLSGDW